jgi:hypothetical protein
VHSDLREQYRMYITRMQVLMVLVLLIVDLYYALNALILLLGDEACARNFSSDSRSVLGRTPPRVVLTWVLFFFAFAWNVRFNGP